MAIDMPSGLYADKAPEDDNGVVWAHHTLSFASPKLVFFLPSTAKFTQQWEILDIGLDKEFLVTTEAEAELIGKYEVLPIYKPRDKFSHKGTFGHSLIIGGSYGKIGAVILTSRSTLGVGAGLVTAFIPKCGYDSVQSAVPEVMVLTDTDENIISKIDFNLEPSVIGIGIGLGTDNNTISAFEAFLIKNKAPLVVDADALNILSEKKSLLKLLPQNSILTPHPGELERLIGTWKDDFDKLKKAKAFAGKYKIVLVLKGAHTITVFNEKLYVNSTGNPGMATAGSGDVLTGMITGLVSQGYDALAAAIFGVYLHGRSGDLASQELGYESITASHITDYLSDAFIDLFKRPEPPQQPKEEQAKKKGDDEELYI